MEALLIFIVGAWIVGFFIVFPLWALSAIRRSERKASEATAELQELRQQLVALEKRLQQMSASGNAPEPATSHVAREEPVAEGTVQPDTPPSPPKRTPPPFVPQPPPSSSIGTSQQETAPNAAAATRPHSPVEKVNWERFMGVNLFAWIGGFVLFLAAAFFVKYSIDKNLISPQVRVAIGFLLSGVLLAAGLRLSGRQFKVTGNTLCATGIVTLYADLYAAHSFYGFIQQPATFLLMILTTVTAIVLAVRLGAKVVAVLGLLGGFVTPVLLSSGVDRPLVLFSYIGFLDAGLIYVALRKRWSFLVLLAAIATVVMQVSWVATFFDFTKVFVAVGIFFAFQGVFLAAYLAALRGEQAEPNTIAPAILMPFVTLGFLFYLLSIPELGPRPGILFFFAFFSSVCLAVTAVTRPSLQPAYRVAGFAIYAALAIWTGKYIASDLLYWALGLYFVFALMQSVFPIVLYRFHREAGPSPWDSLYPVVALVLVTYLLFQFNSVPYGFWAAVLLIDFVAMFIGLKSASVFSFLSALILTIVSILIWMMRMPPAASDLSGFLTVTALFSVVFFAVGLFAGRKIALSDKEENISIHVPVMAAVMPFFLLISAVLHLHVVNPSSVFGLGLVLALLLLGLSLAPSIRFLSLVGLLCMFALQFAWHQESFNPQFAVVPLSWYLICYFVFATFPFLFQERISDDVSPWAAAALSAPLHFYLVYLLVSSAYPNSMMGLLPVAFGIPSLGSLILRVRELPADSPARNGQLAWFGGVTLFFITLIFPVQFEHEWIVIGWSLEGAALLWLHHRISHSGLKVVGAGLLLVVFFWLLNPDFVLLHRRSGLPIFNWYLYTYGIVTAALMTGAKMMKAPHNKIDSLPVQGFLYAMGCVMAFALMNIEIADYYSSGSTLDFKFSGSFARDMTYSIAWACFAFILLIVGIRRKLALARYGSMALIGVTLLKLFFHDLAELTQLYRVGALVGVAVILILASYLYQRFVSFDEKPADAPGE